MPINDTVITAFWKKVNKSGQLKPHMPTVCWEWFGALNDDGYASAWDQESVQGGHRLSWRIANGEIPDGLHVLHKCDTRNCVNPDHLYLGTHQQNMGDKVERGKVTTVGMANSNTILTDEIVKEIRSMYSKIPSYRRLGKLYGLSKSQIANIIQYISWRHI